MFYFRYSDYIWHQNEKNNFRYIYSVSCCKTTLLHSYVNKLANKLSCARLQFGFLACWHVSHSIKFNQSRNYPFVVSTKRIVLHFAEEAFFFLNFILMSLCGQKSFLKKDNVAAYFKHANNYNPRFLFRLTEHLLLSYAYLQLVVMTSLIFH